MNYRHAFHAGNAVDVVKHVALVALLRALARKDKPFFYLETHAGRGRYDLVAEASRRTGEFREGIGRLWAAHAPRCEDLAAYRALVAALNPGLAAGETPRFYPGSPSLAAALARPGDRLVFCELHAEDCAALRALFHGRAGVAVHHRDGYEALKAFLPPAERRGLVFIDPPFEAADEFRAVVRHLGEAYARWPTGVYALWFPIKERASVAALYRGVATSETRRVLRTEFHLAPEGHVPGLRGCGVLIFNPPWQIERTLAAAYGELRAALAPRLGSTRVDWLVPE
ncbi:MAG TPA: 23S rRNA (adenine(2030)-N(6))-methyltransferase RlmJ [Gammaproteobacteria bacterium]|nr:23S rRNA (adenine(2030)-N(6))-methyltransferase RlmJ [Gammaproteobacteria bacterium]